MSFLKYTTAPIAITITIAARVPKTAYIVDGVDDNGDEGDDMEPVSKTAPVLLVVPSTQVGYIGTDESDVIVEDVVVSDICVDDVCSVEAVLDLSFDVVDCWSCA